MNFSLSLATVMRKTAAGAQMIRRVQRLVLAGVCMLLLFGYVSGVSLAEQAGPNPVYIVLWFDTEDYILPPSDDAAKRLAEFLTQHGVQATFKVAGEKARILEQRGRNDVIAALRQHEIGYHSNTHSQHPTPAEYESALDWRTGVDEFSRRERPGFEDVRRIFGKAPCCYGQPGSSWAPQSFAALREWGVRVYLDEGSQVGLSGKPFWYGGLLNIFNTGEGQELRPNDYWDNLEQSKIKFREFYLRMSSEPQGGLISLYFHPCEFIHEWFWDMNFAHGANPPRNQWKQPPQKSAEQQNRTFGYFEELVEYMKTFPNVQFITGSQASSLFTDSALQRGFSSDDLSAIAKAVSSKVTYQERDGYALSAGDILDLLTSYVSQTTLKETRVIAVRVNQTPYGPSSPPPSLGKEIQVPLAQFLSAVVDVRNFMDVHHQVPQAVWLGSIPVPPEAYLVTLAEISTRLLSSQDLPQFVRVAPARLVTTDHIAKDSEKVWDWPIFPKGFHSAWLMDLARLQAWTLKPAILASAQPSRRESNH